MANIVNEPRDWGGLFMTGFMNWFGQGLQTAGSIPYVGFKLLVLLGIVWIVWTIWEHM